MTDSTTTAGPRPQQVRLAITGMTCASCSARIERKLGKVEGIESATVNLATEKAQVVYTAPVTVEQIVAEVERTGYGAKVIPADPDGRPAAGALLDKLNSRYAAHPASGGTSPTARAGSTGRPQTAIPAASAATEDRTPAPPGSRRDRVVRSLVAADLRTRLVVAAALTVPVFLLAMVVPTFPASPWLQLVLATPVVGWCAWPFHRAAAVNARHLASTMDTLVSLGVLAAYLYSLVAVLTGQDHLYFETAAVVTTFLLVGRFLEARAKDSGKDALRSLLDLGAKEVSVLRVDPRTRITGEQRIPVEHLAVGDQFLVRPGEKVATDGVVRDGSSAIDASLVTGESAPVDVTVGDEVTGGT
ncbi:MAG TPA: cation transporter, partial [Intrasporangium sp.]|nr:cation transporter [Intrasporangium sp.]